MEIRIAADEAGKAACAKLRREVFIGEQGVPEQDEVDGLDGICTHVLATSDGKPVGAARFHVVGGAVKIQRVCVSRDFRGRGAGASLIHFIVDHARYHRLAPYARLGSQTHAFEFYRKLGFEAYGDDYIDAGIPHRDMQLKL
ncbi:GNAT family N-acetyltransferase [Mesorhizobium yinganensis]|uniref:GNAT family N-acetyltransferase n=1 Tax=Mesorhizobium yinganensis TaxID=3157707 RepID=UPI0032B7417F